MKNTIRMVLGCLAGGVAIHFALAACGSAHAGPQPVTSITAMASVAEGAVGSATATCPAGSFVVGGACGQSSAEGTGNSFVQSAIDGQSGYTCSFYSNDGVQITATALCFTP